MQTEDPCFIPAAPTAIQQCGTSALWDFMNEPDAGTFSPQISMQDMTHKDMRNCLYINRKGRCQHHVHRWDRHLLSSASYLFHLLRVRIKRDRAPGSTARDGMTFRANCRMAESAHTLIGCSVKDHVGSSARRPCRTEPKETPPG